MLKLDEIHPFSQPSYSSVTKEKQLSNYSLSEYWGLKSLYDSSHRWTITVVEKLKSPRKIRLFLIAVTNVLSWKRGFSIFI